MTNASTRAAQPLLAPCLRDVAKWSAEAPHAPALVGPGKPALTFELLVARIAAIAGMLRDAGVMPGDVVAVAMPDGPEFLAALLGAIEAAAAAPMDWQLTETEFRSRLTQLPVCILLTRSATHGHGAAVAHSLGIPVVELDFDTDKPINVAHHPIPVPEQCALVLQTSATTGEPKLVPLTQTNLHAMCAAVERGLALQSDDRYMSVMPLHHILGLSSALGQLMAGGSVACTGFDGLKFSAWMEELRPTWYAAGPALHQAILEIAKRDARPFHRSPLRFVRCGSGAGSPALFTDLENVLRVSVVNGYGLTEVGCATNTPPQLPRKTGSVGRTIGPEIAIMNANGDLLAPGSEGEVVLRGDAVMDGYLGAEEANREVFRHGWFHSGDLGCMDRDGELFITGRIKEIINRGGETIAPLEIDHALAEHPGILRAASFAVPHPTLDEDIVAAVVLRHGARVAASELRGFLAERISRSKVPGRIWFVESIPVSASGKPLRNTLRSDYLAGVRARQSPESSAFDDESTASLRQRVGAVWMSVLSSDPPSADDNFFAMGGDSLSATRLFTLLRTEFELDDDTSLNLAHFLDSPTFFQLVHVVAQRTQRAEERFEGVSAVCLQPSGDAPALFFFPGANAPPVYLRHLTRCLGDRQPFFALRHELADASDFPTVASRFVTLISRIRPTGPIVLAGHCYGGILAYDVAQRMIEGSRSDVSVVLMDVNAPGYPKARLSGYLRQMPEALRAVLRGEGRRLVREVAEHIRFIRALRYRKPRSPEEVPAHSDPKPHSVAPGAVEPGVVAPAALAPAALTPCTIVLRTYVPKPFPGPLAHVLATGVSPVSERVLQDARKGWRELAQGSFEEHSVHGSHLSIFDAEHAPELASLIRSWLQTATPGRS